MEQYHDLLRKILSDGVDRTDRTGTGTRSYFGHQMRFDMSDGTLPIVTTKKIYTRSVVHELLWFLMGSDYTTYLRENNVHIWDDWELDEFGHVGPIYGVQWRSWSNEEGMFGDETIDQIANVIQSIKNDPYSRRHIVSAWNVADIPNMALPPCHTMFQFNVRPGPDGEPHFLDLQLYQRSGDAFLGVPFNITSYSILLAMVAQVTELYPGTFVHSLGDAHIYNNHRDQVELQLSREHLPLPKLVLNPNIREIDDFQFNDIGILNYKYHPAIPAPISV